MKFLITLSIVLFNSVAVSNAQNISTCLTDVDATTRSTDFFFTEVQPKASKGWSIKYYNTYKILTNIVENETYLLYQCGTEIPQDEIDNGGHSAIVQIPVSNVGIGVTTIIPQLEQLGVVDSIIAFISDPTLISSPCLLSNIEEGNVIVLQTRDEYDNYVATPESSQETLLKLQNAIGFIDPFNPSPPFNASIKVSEYTELTNAGIFEWIKFFSAFYNLEAKANEVFDLTEQRWNCVSEAASMTETADSPKPVVYWMAYIDYCDGWDIGSCPNYYCEYAQQCSATIIESNVTGNFSEICQSNYLSIDDVVEIGKDADYWIYPAPDWNDTYTLFKDKLDTMSVVQNKKVYDFQGSGPMAWFETRAAEYFVVLQDFCSVVGTVKTSLNVNRTYFRNVMDGSPIGNIGTECTENSRSNSILPLVGSVCDDLNLTETMDPPTNSPINPPMNPPSSNIIATPSEAPKIDNTTSGSIASMIHFNSAVAFFTIAVAYLFV